MEVAHRLMIVVLSGVFLIAGCRRTETSSTGASVAVDSPPVKIPSPAPVEPASPAPKTGRDASGFAQFAGEWTGHGHDLHLDAEGWGYGRVQLFNMHHVEFRLRRVGDRVVLEFPLEVGPGPNRRVETEPLAVRLSNGDGLDLVGDDGKLRWPLKKRQKPWPAPTTASFAGDWRVWLVTADGLGVREGRQLILRLKNLTFSLDSAGKGTARFVAEGKEEGKPASVSVRRDADRFILSGLERKVWEIAFFYVEENARALRLWTKDGAIRIYSVARNID
jgi:hypothetical protein